MLKLKIMVVDDSLLMRRHLGQMIVELGHSVIAEAKDGREAIELYSRIQPDLVTMDITMPETDGIEATKEIRKKDKRAKIIMLTASGQEDLVMKAIKFGASGYLLKPVKITKLEESIRKIFPSVAEEAVSDETVLIPLDSDEIFFPEIDEIE